MAIGSVNRYIMFFCVILAFVSRSSCQIDAPRNIEIVYPLWPPPPPPPQAPPVSPPSVPPDNYIRPPPKPRSSKRGIFTAVVATAATVFVLAAVIFLLVDRFSKKRRRDRLDVDGEGSDGRAAAGGGRKEEFRRFDGNVKGYVVDEDGLDVLYWKKLRSNNGGNRQNGNGDKKPAEAMRGRSSSSLGQFHPQDASGEQVSNFLFQTTAESGDGGGQPPLNPPGKQQLMAVPKRTPPPPPPKKTLPIPPPPASKPAVPPPKPPPGGRKSQGSAAGAKASGTANDQVKLKPLHWEKVNINREQSNVWDKVERGSFQYNGDMMEALFGVATATKRKPFNGQSSTSNGEETARIFILDQRKSQNVAIVIKTLGIPHDELIEGLLEGRGLNAETLDKLTRIAVTKEEASQILAFNDDPSKLADAEFFLYNLLRSVPSAFTRANQMLFRLNYDSEIQILKESFRTLQSACNDLKSRGVFLKLLEAILKAGNRLNAGTARGNANAFNLTTLRKLSDYKSSDGKTTLLHFVIHEVVRNEGKRCFLNMAATSSPQDDPLAMEERENEYLKLGLPIVGGLSSEFSNVKKAANIDYDALKSMIGSLSNRIAFASELVGNSGSSAIEGGAFVEEMKEFLHCAVTEMKDVEGEHDRVMEEVKETTMYYQPRKASSSDKNPLQLFVIVKDFLGMVDQACVEIARGVQGRRQPPKGESSSGCGPRLEASDSGLLRPRVSFPRLPKNFMSDKWSSGSDEES